MYATLKPKRPKKDFLSGPNRLLLDSNDASLKTAHDWLYRVSGHARVTEPDYERRMEAYIHADGTHPRETTDVESEQGSVQLGFSEKHREMVMAVERKTDCEQTAAFERDRKVADTDAERLGKPGLVTRSHEDSAAAGIKAGLSDRKDTMRNLTNKAVRVNPTVRKVLPFLESESEKRLLTRLKGDKKALAENGDTHEANLSRKKTRDDKQIDTLNTVVTRKQQKKTQFHAVTRKAREDIREQVKRTGNDTLDLLLKKKTLLDAVAEQPDIEIAPGEVQVQESETRKSAEQAGRGLST